MAPPGPGGAAADDDDKRRRPAWSFLRRRRRGDRSSDGTPDASPDPPSYEALYGAGADVTDGFEPTLELEMDAAGRGPWPTSSQASLPVAAYVVDGADGADGVDGVDGVDGSRRSSASASARVGNQPALVSLPRARGSGASDLVAGPGFGTLASRLDASAHDGRDAVAGLDVVLRTLSTASVTSATSAMPRGHHRRRSTRVQLLGPGPAVWDTVDVQGASSRPHAPTLCSARLGTLAWRWTGRAERRTPARALFAVTTATIATAATAVPTNPKADEIDSLLVLDRIIPLPPATASITGTADGLSREARRPVARFLSSTATALHPSGSSRHAARGDGGGRLQIDLRAWPAVADADSTTRQMAVVLVVTSLVCMLKETGHRKDDEAAAV